MKNPLPLFLFLLLFSCKKEQPTPAPPTKKDTLFERLSPEHTGIDFLQTITEEYRYNFSMDANIFNGGGVAVLDVDNDGLQDLFFTSRLQPCKIYLNKGELKFEDITEGSGVEKYIGIKTGVTVVDINMDGWQDVYVCRTFLVADTIRKNLLFVNNKDNTFSERAAEYGLADMSPTQHAHFFDYDLDGDLDCYILNHPVDYTQINKIDFQPSANAPYAGMRPPLDEWESDKLYENKNGKYIDVSKKAGINNRAWGLSVMSADFNEDGFPDIYVANDFIMPDFLYVNNGDGTFTDKIHDYFQHITNHAMGIEIADLNNDGLPEVAALDMLGENWERRHKQLTTMQLERQKQLNRQGYGDQQMRNTLQLNNGPTGASNNHFSEIGCLANMFDTEWSWAPLMADFDNDGWKDLFITNGVRRDLNDIDFFVFTADSINRTGGIGKDRFAKFEDYSNLMPSQKIKNRIFKNNASLQLEDVTDEWGFSDPTFSNGAAYTDLDNDGDLDLVVHNIEDVPFIYRNKSEGNNWLQIKLKGTKENPVGVGAKIKVFNNDELISFQEISPTRGFYSAVEPVFQIGLGKKNKVDLIQIYWPGGKHEFRENINANQRIVFDIADAKDGKIAIKPARPLYFEKISKKYFTHFENQFEDFNVQFLLPHRLSRLGPALATGDVNGDGMDDFFIGGAYGQEGALFFQNKKGEFANSNNKFDRAYEDTGALFFDADGDGDNDLYIACGGTILPVGNVSLDHQLYLNDGKGRFSKDENFIKINTSGKAVAAHDYDNDGDLDLFVGGRVVPGNFPLAPESFILENNNGQFKNVTETVCPAFKNIGMVTDIKFADINNDNKKEMIVTGEWMPITVFNNNSDQFSISQFLNFSISGWWNCLETADLDGDGDLDLIGGNLGLNSRFEAPLYLYAKDFDNNGSIDPILCVEENGRQLPVPMRDELIKQLPYLKKKFVRNTAYAKTDINGVFSKNELANALQLKTDELASCWFENNNGEFIKHQLPDEAQISPVHGILAQDINSDGHLDLLLVGNDSGFDVHTGPLDTSPGYVLLGDGKGGFKYVPPHKTGFWATGEARGIYPIKNNNLDRIIYLIPNNDNDLLMLEGK